MVEWKISSDKYGNEYFYYPAQDDVFKKMVAENGGFCIDIYDSNNVKIKRKPARCHDKEWNVPVLTYIKSMSEGKLRINEKFRNCKLYAVPNNQLEVLDSMIENNIDNLILNYANFKKTKEYDEQYKFDFALNNKGIFSNLDDLAEKIKQLGNPNFQSYFMRNSGIRHMIALHMNELTESFIALFNADNNLETRITNFRNIIKETLLKDDDWHNKETADPTFSTAAYFLFANDYTSNLLFTQVKPFTNFAKIFNLTSLLNYKDNEQRYINWQTYCLNELIPKMNAVLKTSNTLLDAGDFIWYVNRLYNNDKNQDDIEKQIKELHWWEISALGMYLNDKLKQYKPNEVKTLPIVQYAMKLKDVNEPSIGTELRECSNDTTSDYKRKNEYFVRHEDTYYSLNENGLNYVENDLKQFLNIDIPKTKSEKAESEDIMSEINIPLNQILYGPPGTGKTYNTANLALKILEPDFNSNNRDEIMAKYNDYKKNKQIQFVTFHQAYSYEEFVEGIRPILDDKSSELKYQIHNGIFKNIVELARSEYAKAQVEANIDFSNINIFKMSLGNTLEKDDVNIFDYCIENNCIALGYGENEDFSNGNSKDEIKNIFQNSEKLKNETLFTVDAIDRFKNWMKIGDLVFISNGNTSVRAIGKITGDYYFKDDAEIRYCQFRNVQWLYNDINIPVDKFLNKNLSQQTIYQFFKDDLKFDYISALLTGKKPIDEIKKYVLVIDEINRGEIAKIFGELITLIEDTKRDSLDVILPYSNKSFSIPKNLYIIGTMNTADRSIALLDIALRRRFDFIAKYPNSSKIGEDGALTEVEQADLKIDLKLFLDKMNERIEVLLDKDHTIGHSYLMGIKNYDDFIYKFKNRILPLLQEYFYNDYDNIAKVLNQDNIDDSEWNNKEDKIILKYCGIDDRPKYQINEDFPIQAFLKVCK